MSEPQVPLGLPKAKETLTVGLVLGVAGYEQRAKQLTKKPVRVRLQHSQELRLLWSIRGLSHAGLPGPFMILATAFAVAAKEGILRKTKRKGEERKEVGRLSDKEKGPVI